MTADTPDSGQQPLQFDSAEPAGAKPAGPVCALCQQPIAVYYYEAAGKVVCSSCKNKVAAATVSGVAASSFLRALGFGLAGALAGAAVYYAVLATTGYEIGLIAILVGFMVGYAVRMGARGQGGRRYQILALSLTYLAIGGTYVPLAMRELKQSDAGAADSLRAGGRDSTAAGVETASVSTVAAPDSGAARASLSQVALGLAALTALAAAMPILVVVFGLPQSLISALIIGFALHQAWRMTRGIAVTFTGPFKVGAAGT